MVQSPFVLSAVAEHGGSPTHSSQQHPRQRLPGAAAVPAARGLPLAVTKHATGLRAQNIAIVGRMRTLPSDDRRRALTTHAMTRDGKHDWKQAARKTGRVAGIVLGIVVATLAFAI